ncbi:MAG: hypothetical protein K5650_00050 [Bacteroidales bacterium]|nr:hypothetical protein [Bacteroidales bacterium]
MKIRRLLPFAVVALMATACVPNYSEHRLYGILYSDSTQQTAVPGMQLNFREDGLYLGSASTNAQGHWGFQYVRNMDNPYRNAKLSMVEHCLVVTNNYNDTVAYKWMSHNNSSDTITTFIGYMDWVRSNQPHNDSDTTGNDNERNY